MTDTATRRTVLLVDDDPSVRRGLSRLLRSVGLAVQAYAAADELIAVPLPDTPCCLILDIRMPGMSGLALQQRLVELGRQVPIVFLSGHGDIPMSVQAMKLGAVDFLTKPCSDQALLDAVERGLEQSARARAGQQAHTELARHADQLTERELEVVRLVARGMLNKQVGAELGIAEKTVKIHRANAMQKLGAHSLADLVRMADKLGL